MPVTLAKDHHEAWLTNQAGKEVSGPFPADAMPAWPISPRVNSPKNDDPDLIKPQGDWTEYRPSRRAMPF
jgi:putative SOS response-associated peptidase YedK